MTAVPDLAELERLAQAAQQAGKVWTVGDLTIYVDPRPLADFQAAANPAAILDFIARLRRAEAALRNLEIATGDYIWELSPRDALGVCILCQATEGEEHNPEKSCGGLNNAYLAANQFLRAALDAQPR